MDKNRSANYLTEDPPTLAILRFVLPILGCNLVQQIYTLLDTTIAGAYLGETGLAVVGANNFVYNFVIMSATGLTSGLALREAYCWGRDDEEGLKKCLTHSLGIVIAASVLLTAVGMIFIEPIMTLMNIPGSIRNECRLYLDVVFAGTAAVSLYYLSTAFLRAVGRSTITFVILVIGAVSNIGLLLIMIGSLHMGPESVALALILSQAAAAVMSFGYMAVKMPALIPDRAAFHYDSDVMKVLVGSGAAMCLSFALGEIANLVLQSAVNTMDTTIISAYIVGRRAIDIGMAPIVALSVGIPTYVSQNLGAGREERVPQGIRVTNIIYIAWSAAVIAVFIVFSTALAHFISGGQTDAELIEPARRYMIVMSCFLPCMGVVLVYRQTLQAFGRKIIAVGSGVIELIIKLIISTSIISGAISHGRAYDAVCFTEPIIWVVNGAVLAVSFYTFYRKYSMRNESAGIRNK